MLSLSLALAPGWRDGGNGSVESPKRAAFGHQSEGGRTLKLGASAGGYLGKIRVDKANPQASKLIFFLNPWGTYTKW